MIYMCQCKRNVLADSQIEKNNGKKRRQKHPKQRGSERVVDDICSWQGGTLNG